MRRKPKKNRGERLIMRNKREVKTVPLPRVNGRSYQARGQKVLVTKATRDNPPRDWHVSTPCEDDPTGVTRWYWLFFGVGFTLLALASLVLSGCGYAWSP